ncbi:MAG: DNA polymerase Y family protein [Hyphomicrobiales bacterium]|nr:DNA polymerase Y family protein [Hyphomicrobiales bacterium]
MRFLSLHLPTLRTDRVARQMRAAATPKAPDEPLATIARLKGAWRLAGLDARAGALGLRSGMGLADARAMHPGLLVAEADAVAEAALYDQLLAWCRRFTPLAAADGPDGMALDVTGVAHLFGGEAALAADVVARLARQGIGARVGIGPNPAVAWALARFARQPILPPAIEMTRLPGMFADFPVAALNISDDLAADLARAGLRRIGDLSLRPRAPLTARFGADLLDRLDHLFGQARSPISPRFAAPDFSVERRFADGLTREDALLTHVGALARELCALMIRHGQGARSLTLTLFRVDGAVRLLEVAASQAMSAPGPMLRLVREKLARLNEGGFETGYGFDVLRLEATQTAPQKPDQGALAGDAGRHGAMIAAPSPAEPPSVSAVIDRLSARLGAMRVTRLHLQDSHQPERAARHAAALAGAPPAGGPRPWPEAAWERPVRLLARPEPVETLALLPDGLPQQFRWRRVLHRVIAADGPERILSDWWKSPAPGMARDYFRAEDEAGQRFWLFRQQQAGAGATWFMHGFFP